MNLLSKSRTCIVSYNNIALPCRLPFYGLLTLHASFLDFIASKSPPVRPVLYGTSASAVSMKPYQLIGWPMKSPMRPFMLWIPNFRRFLDCHPDIATSMLSDLKRILSISWRSMSAMFYPTSTFFTRFTFCQTLYVTTRPRCISRTKMPPMPSTANLHPKHRSSHGVCMNQQFLATNDSASPERRLSMMWDLHIFWKMLKTGISCMTLSENSVMV